MSDISLSVRTDCMSSEMQTEMHSASHIQFEADMPTQWCAQTVHDKSSLSTFHGSLLQCFVRLRPVKALDPCYHISLQSDMVKELSVKQTG